MENRNANIPFSLIFKTHKMVTMKFFLVKMHKWLNYVLKKTGEYLKHFFFIYKRKFVDVKFTICTYVEFMEVLLI